MEHDSEIEPLFTLAEVEEMGLLDLSKWRKYHSNGTKLFDSQATEDAFLARCRELLS